MSSVDLKKAQDVIQDLIISEIKEPMKNWSLINKYISVLKDVDNKRRKAWNKEKFGTYEDMANEVLVDFSVDEIPF